jgi:hypothetical protein
MIYSKPGCRAKRSVSRANPPKEVRSLIAQVTREPSFITNVLESHRANGQSDRFLSSSGNQIKLHRSSDVTLISRSCLFSPALASSSCSTLQPGLVPVFETNG